MRRIHWLVLLSYTLLAVALTYPLVAHLTTHVPGSDTWAYDEYTFLWNIWYFKEALVDRITTPLHTELLFYPVSLDLVMYTFNLMAAALALPLVLAAGVSPAASSGVPLASNLVNLASSVLGAYGTFLLVRYLLAGWSGVPAGRDERESRLRVTARDAAAFLAGIVYAFASSRSVYLALGHYMIVTTQWVPYFVLYLLRTLRHWSRRDAALAGLFAGLALLTDMIYGVLLALLALALAADCWWRRPRRRQPRESVAYGPTPSGQGPSHVGGRAPRSPRRAGSGRQILGGLTLMAVIAAAVSAPLLIPTVREGLSADYAVEGWGHAEDLSADLVGLVTPTALNPLANLRSGGEDWIGELRAVQTGDSQFSDVNTIFLGYVTLGLALLGAIAGRRHARVWALIALISGLLALGPLLQINGQSVFDLDGLQVTVPLPFIGLHYLPFVQGFRAPNRFSIVLMLALAVLVGYGMFWALGQVLALQWRSRFRPLFPHADTGSWGRRTLAVAMTGVLSTAVLIEHLALPMPLTDARVPVVYEQVAAQSTRLEQTIGCEDCTFAIMQLPMGWRNGFGVFGAEDTRVQWYQSVHGQPILSGNTSRNPPFKFEYFQRQPLLQAVAGVEMYQEPGNELDLRARQSVDDLMALWNVRYLVVNPPVPSRYPYVDTWEAAREYALDVLPVSAEPIWAADGVEVYEVNQRLVPFPFNLDFGAQNTSAYRGPGWSVDESNIGGATAIWALGREAEAYLPLRIAEPVAVELILRVQPFSYPGAPPQAVTVEFNGVDLGTRAVTPGWQELRFPVPADAIRYGLNRVRLRHAHSARPADVLPDQGLVGTTGAQLPVDVEINSGGGAGDFAFISVADDQEHVIDASAGRRGYNLATIDAQSGEVTDVRGFDTWANPFEADALADFIEGLPEGTIVLVAARDDASRSLTDRAVRALAGIGSAIDLRQTPGYGHALIGVKGAAPGTAAEMTGPDEAYLRVASDRRPLSLAVDWLRVGSVR